MNSVTDTVTEFEPIEVAEGEFLDIHAERYGVSRMTAEPDNSLRERVRDAMNIRRAADKSERGESLIPPEMLHDDTPTSIWPGADEVTKLQIERDQLKRELENMTTRYAELCKLYLDLNAK